jgi:hypothetical protein
MFEGTDTVILYEELAFQDVLPVSWRPLVVSAASEKDVAASFEDRNVRLLQAWEAMQEHGSIEKTEESAYAAEILRLDMKLNLLLDLVGQLLVANHPRPKPTSVRFNALGAVWHASGPLPEAGAQGVAEIYLRECLAEPLRLPGRVTNVTPDGYIKIKFLPLSETVADLIEKLAFRRHRRQIAGSRHPRR